VAIIKEIQVFPMIQDEDGSSRIINSKDKQNEQPDAYDVIVSVRDEDTHEHIEDHPDYQEFDDLTKDQAAFLLYQLETKYPDASSEWIEEDRPDWPSERGYLPPPDRTIANERFSPATSFDILARSLPPLDFIQQKDRWDTNKYEFTYEASFMQHKFTIEHLLPEDKWALFLEEPQVAGLTKSPDTLKARTLVDEQDHSSMQSAVDSAELHRTRLIAKAMGIKEEPTQEIIAKAATTEALLRDGHLVTLEDMMQEFASRMLGYAESVSMIVSDPEIDRLIRSHCERAQREIEDVTALIAAYQTALDQVAENNKSKPDAEVDTNPSPSM